MLTEAIKAFLKIFGVILVVAFVVGILFGLFQGRLRGGTTEVVFQTFRQGLEHISGTLSKNIVEERGGGAADFSHLPRLFQISNQSRLRKSKTVTFVFESESNRPVLTAYLHSNAVYLVELTNLNSRAQIDVWTHELSVTFPGLHVITTDHR